MVGARRQHTTGALAWEQAAIMNNTRVEQGGHMNSVRNGGERMDCKAPSLNYHQQLNS